MCGCVHESTKKQFIFLICILAILCTCACSMHDALERSPQTSGSERVEREREREKGCRGGGSSVRPATAALTCQRCHTESTQMVEGKFKKNSDTFLFRTAPGQRYTTCAQSDERVKEQLKSKSIYINSHQETAGEPLLILRDIQVDFGLHMTKDKNVFCVFPRI